MSSTSAFARAQSIKVTVGVSTILWYSNEFETNSTLVVNRLRLLAPREIEIPEGTEVRIGKNYYAVVNRFYSQVSQIPKSTHNKYIQMELPIGTGVCQENGLGVNLAAPLTVNFPVDGTVRLPSGLLLQQTDALVKLTLFEETDVVLAGCAFK
jgi:hypothetical protein